MRLISAAAVVAALAFSAPAGRIDIVAACPRGEIPNPAGYGCVPAVAGGGAVIGAPTEGELSACHGDLYFCVDPYGRQ